MGRDQLGGEAVNLTPSDKPRDTYTDFANYVNDLRVQDAAKGHVLARKLDGLITRKVCVYWSPRLSHYLCVCTIDIEY